MFETPYYHELIKKATIGFGALFSRIKVLRRNPNDANAASQVISVPIAFGPKEKILTRLEQDPSQTGHTYITLPRMAFEINGYNYDTSRMVNRNNKIQCYKDNTVTAIYSPVPYNVEFSLYILTKGTEDGLAIIEQILPLFTPEYSFTVNAIPELNVVQDIPVVLNGISVSDDYEGDFAVRRLVTHTLTFTAKLNLFGNLQTSGVITRVDADLKKFQNYTASMDNDGNIVVDSWNPQSRESFESPLAASTTVSITTVGTTVIANYAQLSSNVIATTSVSAALTNSAVLVPLSSDIMVTVSTSADLTNSSEFIPLSSNVSSTMSTTAALTNSPAAMDRTYSVVANGASSYTFSGDATGDNPTLNVVEGDILTFNVDSTNHPFWIKTEPVTGTGSGVTTGSITGNGTETGTVIWDTTGVSPGTYFYICQFHSSMHGQIVVSAAA